MLSLENKMILKYFWSLLRHKYFVFVAGMKLGGIGFWRLILHDASKYSLKEFLPYARQFFGSYPSWKEDNLLVRFPSYTGLTKESVKNDFDVAWNYHQKRNPHHFQMWILINDEDRTYPLPMPKVYIREMVADWLGASMAYTGSWVMVNWMNRNLNNYADKMHQDTINYLWEVLHDLGYLDNGHDGWYYRPHLTSESTQTNASALYVNRRKKSESN